MHDLENKEAGKWLEWWYGNQNAWELICGDRNRMISFTMKEAVQILKDMADRELYQLAIVLLHQLMKNSCIDEAVIHAVAGRLGGESSDRGIISECIAAAEKALIENNAMNHKVML